MREGFFPKSVFLGFLLPALVFIVGPCPLAHAKPPYEAGKVVGIHSFHGSPKARDFLLRKGFVLPGWTRKTMFEFYKAPRIAPFVTTDAAWDFYQRVLEKAFLAGEKRRALFLPHFLRRILGNVLESGDPGMGKAACYAAVSMALMGEGLKEEALTALGKEERALVKATLGKLLHPVGDPEGIQAPFLRFKVAPRFEAQGFYGSSRLLESFWRAYQWLQYAAFDMNDPQEGRAAIVLAQAVFRDPEVAKAYERFQGFYRDWMGWEDRYGLEAWARVFREVLGEGWKTMDPGRAWKAVRNWKGKKPCRSILDFRVPGKVRREVVLAFFSPAETGVYKFFFEDMKRTAPFRGWIPSALDLLASGPLESRAGREIFKETFGGTRWGEALLSISFPSLGRGMYGDGIRALRLLQGPPHKGAGPPFGSAEWRAKMAWTQLGGLAGIEHSFCLYRTPFFLTAACGPSVTGAVSPYPGFFLFLGRLLRKGAGILERNKKEFPPDYSYMAELVYLRARDYYKELVSEEGGGRAAKKHPSGVEMQRVYSSFLGKGGGFIPITAQGKRDILRAGKRVLALAKGAEMGKTDKAWLEKWFPEVFQVDFHRTLGEGASILERLGALSEKEWRGESLTEEEASFLRDLGSDMSWVLQRAGGMYYSPLPTFSPPFVAELAEGGPLGNPCRLYVGIARPEALYIILERNGRPRLFLGGVLSFREFVLPWKAKMDDSTWGRWVEEDKCPGPPLFTKTFRVTGK